MQAAAPTARLGEQLPGLTGVTGMQLDLVMGLESLAVLQGCKRLSTWNGSPANPRCVACL